MNGGGPGGSSGSEPSCALTAAPSASTAVNVATRVIAVVTAAVSFEREQARRQARRPGQRRRGTIHETNAAWHPVLAHEHLRANRRGVVGHRIGLRAEIEERRSRQVNAHDVRLITGTRSSRI